MLEENTAIQAKLSELFEQMENVEDYLIVEEEDCISVYLKESVPVPADYYGFLLKRLNLSVQTADSQREDLEGLDCQSQEQKQKIQVYQVDAHTLARLANGENLDSLPISVQQVEDLCETARKQSDSVILDRNTFPVEDAIFSPALKKISLGEEVEEQRKLAISDGGNVTDEEISRYLDGDLSQFLYEAARDSDRGIVFIKEDQSRVTVTYKELAAKAEKIASAIQKLTFPEDRILMFQFPDNQDFLEMFWGCVLANVIPVPVQVCDSYDTIDANVSRVYNIWKILKKPPIVTTDSITDKVKHMNELYEESFSIYGFSDFLHEEEPYLGSHQGNIHDTALIMFTSGSTGLPKGVKLSHYNLICQVIGQIALNGFTGEDISMNWMPLTHVGGIIYFHLRDVYLRIKQIHVDISVILSDVTRWLSIINEFRASITWAPNFAFKLVNDALATGKTYDWDLSCMHTFLNGGEAVIASVGLDFVDNLTRYGMPDTALKPSYGMSETSSGTIYNFAFNKKNVARDDSFVSVGLIIPGDKMRIVDDADQVKYEGEIGRFQVKGKTITSGYYNNEKATAESYTKDGWFNTGDLAFIKNDRLTITGREKDVIIINGVNYYNHEIESELEKLEEVKSSFCMAGSVTLKPGTPEGLLIIYCQEGVEDACFLEKEKDLTRLMKSTERKIRQLLALNFNLFPLAVVCVPAYEILKTDIGKLQRKKMAELFLAGEYEKYNRGSQMIFREEPVKPSFITRKWIEKKLIKRISGTQDTVLISEKPNSEFSKQVGEAIYNGLAVSFAEAMEMTWDDTKQVKVLIELEEVREESVYDQVEALQNSFSIVEALPVKKAAVYVITKNACFVDAAGYVNDKVGIGSVFVGILESYAQESQKAVLHHIDVDDNVTSERITEEILYGHDSIVAYRMEHAGDRALRFIPLLASWQDKDFKSESKILTEEALVLVTGATGGLGRRFLAYLTKQVGCHVAVLGRKSREEAYGLFTKEHAVREKISYYQGDITDLSFLEDSLQDAVTKTGKSLTGIYHLAGSVSVLGQGENHWEEFQQHMFVKEQIPSFKEVFQSKIWPAKALVSLHKNYPDSFLFLISSINGYFGGASLSAYAAGNSYLTEAGAMLHAQDENVMCVSFSNINNIGMSKEIPSGMKEASGKNGFGLLDVWDVIALLDYCVERRVSDVFVGLTMNSENLSNRYIGKKQDKWMAYAKPECVTKAAEIVKQQMPDKTVEASSVMDWYRSLDLVSGKLLYGEEWKTEIGHLFCIEEEEELVLPATELERTLYAIWAEHTGNERFSTEDSYFAIGGNSINSFQTIAHINEVYKTDLSITDFFQYSSIQGLAEYLQELAGQVELEEERGMF